MEKIDFKSVIRFTFKGQKYEAFKSRDEKLAFLKIVDGKYDYPTLSEFRALVTFFDDKGDISLFDDKIKKFIPCIKGKLNGKIATVALTSALALAALTGCANTETIIDNYAITVENDLKQELTSDEDITNEDIKEATQELEELDTSAIEVDDAIIDEIPDELRRIFETETEPEWAYTNDIQDRLNYLASNIDYVNDTQRKKLNLFNDKYFDIVFGEENVSLDELNTIIDENNKIDTKYKDFVKDFTKTMLEYYDGIDTRIYAENLKDLRIYVGTEDDVNEDAIAEFDAMTREITLTSEFDVESPRSRCVLRHELAHMFNNVNKKFGDYTVTYRFNYNRHGSYLKEGLNVVFSSKPFEEEYENMYLSKGYTILENITTILTDSIDYDFRNYVTSNVYGFEYEVNSKSNSDLGFNYIEDIYEFIWDDYKTIAEIDEDGISRDEFEVDFNFYTEFYDYLSRLYLNKYVTDTTTAEDVDAMYQEFLDTLTNKIVNYQVIDYNVVNDVFTDQINLINEHSYAK